MLPRFAIVWGIAGHIVVPLPVADDDDDADIAEVPDKEFRPPARARIDIMGCNADDRPVMP